MEQDLEYQHLARRLRDTNRGDVADVEPNMGNVEVSVEHNIEQKHNNDHAESENTAKTNVE